MRWQNELYHQLMNYFGAACQLLKQTLNAMEHNHDLATCFNLYNKNKKAGHSMFEAAFLHYFAGIYSSVVFFILLQPKSYVYCYQFVVLMPLKKLTCAK